MALQRNQSSQQNDLCKQILKKMLLYMAGRGCNSFPLSLDFKRNDDGCTNMITPDNNTLLAS